MAWDEYALHAAGRDGVPRLRLYTWDRLTVSVGRAQQVERQIDLAACGRLGIPIVRRITGGRAVLHGSDLTYSLAAPLAGPPGSAAPFDAAARAGILGLYRELSRVFVRFFERLGLAPQVQAHTGRQRAESASPVCFATPSAFEILLGGRKIVGSAQRLLPGAFLQHGSIPLAPQEDILARVFLDGAGVDMARHMTDLTTAGTLREVTLGELRTLLAECFASVLGVELAPATWSEADRSAVRRLAAAYTDLAGALPVPRAAAAVQ
ncbi:MAG: biotin/lipoate A/B protein ligase family protein [SAR324 cluster bacterium]